MEYIRRLLGVINNYVSGRRFGGSGYTLMACRVWKSRHGEGELERDDKKHRIASVSFFFEL